MICYDESSVIAITFSSNLSSSSSALSPWLKYTCPFNFDELTVHLEVRWERQLLEHIEDGRERLKFKLKSSPFLKTFHRHFSVSSIHFFIFTTSDSQVRTKMKRRFASKAEFPHIHSGSNGKISWLALPFRKGCKQNVPHFHCASLCFSVGSVFHQLCK